VPVLPVQVLKYSITSTKYIINLLALT